MPGPGRIIARGAAGVLAAAAVVASVGACLPSSLRSTPSPSPSPSVAPASSAPATRAPTPAPPTPTPAPSFLLHTVGRGDTLTSLGRRYGTSGRSIAYWNRDQYPSLDPESADYAPDDLRRGWVLRILPGQEYVPPPDDGETGESPTPSPPDDEYEVESPSP